ncbi:MAG: hypothetical protein WB421_18430 [Terriglobales bacterium]
MPQDRVSVREPRWYLIPVRVLLVTFLLTALGFAISLLLGILGILAGAKLRGVHPNMTMAYRHIAAPAAAAIAVIVLVTTISMEIRHYRQAKVLADIERAS